MLPVLNGRFRGRVHGHKDFSATCQFRASNGYTLPPDGGRPVAGGECRSTVMSDKPGFLDELKRRHVWRVSIAYAVSGWLLLQIATQVFPFFGIPDWAVRLVVILVAIGFPVAVALAWIYEITPQGIRRTTLADSSDARPEHERRSVGQKLNAIIIVVLVMAVALLGWRLYAEQTPRAASQPDVIARASGPVHASLAGPVAHVSRTAANSIASGSPTRIPEKSVAVLPFANDSGKPDEQFFSDGLSDDLIVALSQFAGLKVISRSSAFQFRDSRESSHAIGEKLGVAHLLEGSVQRVGNEVRITAALVNATDGSILWSQRYDRPYQDLFALQDAITRSVADALQARLLATAGAVAQSDRPPSGSVAAFEAYQQGNAYVARNSEAGFRQAIGAYDKAIRLDPRYAAAYAKLSVPWLLLSKSFLGGADALSAASHARHAVESALQLDPDLAVAHFARSQWLLNVAMDWGGAEAEARRALQLAPNDAAMQFNLANVSATMGQLRQAVALTRHALERDPYHADWYYWLSAYLTSLGQLDEAHNAIETAISLQPGASVLHLQLAVVEIQAGNARQALQAARQETSGLWRRIAFAQALKIGTDRVAADSALKALVARQANLEAVQIAETYALRRDPDAMFHWLEGAWVQRDPGLVYLLYDPLLLRYRDDLSFAAFCRKIGLPATTDALAVR